MSELRKVLLKKSSSVLKVQMAGLRIQVNGAYLVHRLVITGPHHNDCARDVGLGFPYIVTSKNMKEKIDIFLETIASYQDSLP